MTEPKTRTGAVLHYDVRPAEGFEVLAARFPDRVSTFGPWIGTTSDASMKLPASSRDGSGAETGMRPAPSSRRPAILQW